MKILKVSIDANVMKSNIDQISDSTRILIFKENEDLFRLLDFKKDEIFLEPSLFSYFINLDIGKDSTLDQILWGHIVDEKKKKNIKVRSDAQGYINMPNFGYLKVSQGNCFFSLELLKELQLFKNGKKIKFDFLDFFFLKGTNTKVCYHEPAILTEYLKEDFRTPIKVSFEEYYEKLQNSFNLLKIASPILYDLIRKYIKEIYVFNGRNRESLAALSFFGSVLLNIDNQNRSEVFFLDDLSHQCGHIIFYTLTLDTKDFLIPEPREKLKKFTKVEWEVRDVYGVFHGLFTYTCILNTLDKSIQKKIFQKKKLIEVYARIGFYMNKFIKDLARMNNNEILTEKGFEYYDQFKAGYDYLEKKYKNIYRNMHYDNKTYMFNFEEFLNLNDLENLYRLIEIDHV